MTLDPTLAAEANCYLTITGRVTGRPHALEIWFGASGDTIYLLSGGRSRSDWVRNLRKRPAVSLRIAGQHFTGDARIVTDPAEETVARRLLFDKYNPTYSVDLTRWSREALPIAIDLQTP